MGKIVTADPVAEAATMIATLADRRAEALSRKSRTLEQIAALAYAAICEDNKSAQARTTELSAAVGQIDLEIVALNAAESEARRRQTAAKTAAERAAVLVKVEKAQGHLVDFRFHGGRAATLFTEWLQAYDKTIEAGSEIRRLGIIRTANHEVLTGNIRDAIQSALRGHRDLRSEPLLRISQRDLTGTIDFLADQMKTLLDRIVSGETPAPVEYEPPPPLELLPGEAELLRAEAMAAAEAAAEIDEDAPEAEAAE